MTASGQAPGRLTGSVILVVEDHDVLGASLATVLTAAGAYAETAADVTPAGCSRDVDRLLKVHGRVLILLDLDLGRNLTGEALLPGVLHQGVQVLVLTGCEEPVRLSRLIRGGVSGVLSKTEPLEHVLAAVEALFRGDCAMSAEAATTLHLAAMASEAERAKREQPFRTLTHREGEVLFGLMKGRTVTELADESVLSVQTVRSQVNAILVKLGVHSQLAAVGLAKSAGWSGGFAVTGATGIGQASGGAEPVIHPRVSSPTERFYK